MESNNKPKKEIEKPKSKLNDLKKKLDSVKKDLILNPVETNKVTNTTDDTKLTARQSDFIDHYLTTNSVTKAAIAAGYSEESAAVQGSKTLAKPHIQTELLRRQKIFMLEHGITREYILQEILDVIEHSKSDPEGRKNSDILKALDILNKMSGNYTQTNVNVNIEIPPIFPDIN